MTCKRITLGCALLLAGGVLVFGLKEWHAYHALSFSEHVEHGHCFALANYLKAGNPIEMRDPEGRTLLVQSIIAGQPRLTAFLLHNGASPNAVDAHGVSAVATALNCNQDPTAARLINLQSSFSDADKIALLNHPVLAQQFIEKHPLAPCDLPVLIAVFRSALRRADFNQARRVIEWGIELKRPGATGPQELMRAARMNNADVVRFLLEQGVPVDIKGDPDNQTALILAARKDAPEVVNLLLEKGADPLLTDDCGLYAISHAARNNNFECAKCLLEHGVSPNTDGCSPLVLACLFGNDTRLVKLFLENGAALEQTDDYGHSALLAAVRCGNAAKAELLLASGADFSKENEEGENIAMLAIRSGNPELLAFIIQQTGFDVNRRNSKNQSLLTAAAQWGGHAALTWLLDHGARVPDDLDDDGFNATLCAAVSGNVDDMTALNQHGANLNIQSPVHGLTPLMTAVRNGHVEMVTYLIRAGARADLHATTGRHETALELAQENNQREIVALLKSVAVCPSERDAQGSGL